MKLPAIYKIQSIVKPERIYIGSAISINQRWAVHKFDLKRNKHSSVKLQNHYNKYGKDDLVFIIIEPCFPEFLLIREQYYIDTLNPYFNTCKVAGSQLGLKRSKEALQKMKGRIPWNKGIKGVPESVSLKMSEARIGNKNCVGRKYTEATIKKMKISAEIRWRNPISEGTREKMRKSHKNRKK